MIKISDSTKKCSLKILLGLIILLMVGSIMTTTSTAQDTTAPPSSVGIEEILSITNEDYPDVKDFKKEPVMLINMAKPVLFKVRFQPDQLSIDFPVGNTTTPPGNNDYKIVFEVTNGNDWNITCTVDEEVQLQHKNVDFYLSDSSLARSGEENADKELIFSLAYGEKIEFTIEIKPLSSVSLGDKVDIHLAIYDSIGNGIFASSTLNEGDMAVEISMEDELPWEIYVGLAAAAIGLLFAFYLRSTVMKKDRGNENVIKISDHIHKGAMAFLNKEYRILLFFTLGVTMILVVAARLTDEMSYLTAVTFVVGAIFSAIAGNIGMRIATAANGRTATAVKNKMIFGLRIAFSSGAVMGLTVVSLGLLGISIFYIIFNDPNILFGFGFGASSIALFARVGGGIYTKSADVGADLVGKVEKGIPEDDPRNPATIADNVGDNVGDVAGMGADLFESYVDSIIAAMILGLVGVMGADGVFDLGGVAGKAVLLPLIIAGIGIICSIIGIVIVNSSSDKKEPHSILNTGIFGAAILQSIASFLVIRFWMGPDYFGIWGAMMAGLVSGVVIGLITEYYTSDEFKPTRGISEASKTGPATNIIAGLSLGMFSTMIPVVMVCVALVFSYWQAGLYGIALAAVGMLSTLGITLATDSYGPVADNAAGIAEMANMGSKVRERAEKLDAVGNTTAAIGKGFAIGSAALTALALFSTYTQATHLSFGRLSLMDPLVITGVFIGALLVFLFSALTMNAVGKAAMAMVEEVRRQFKEIKGLMKGKAEPDYKKCVDIATGGALKQMIFPSLLAVAAPVAVGLILGPAALGGLLGGAVVVGFLMAIMMANSGGAWDNAKKYVEAGNLGGKGSTVHKASVVGDTVGDPFKDTSGPALNILIKLMSIVSLVFAPLFLLLH